MSAGGVFKLIANDGKADRMIMATELLNCRIAEIMQERRARGFADPTPTLVDIERTHILFVNAHFKPFAAIGYEYNKVRPQTGSSQLGGSVTFSIPQFGDFFCDMVFKSTISQAQANAGTLPALATIPDVDVGNVRTSQTQAYVDSEGAPVAPGAWQDYVKYVDFPGHRLLRVTKFDVNGNPLDQYNSDSYNFHYKTRVRVDKRDGWSRMVGQEVPLDAHSELTTVTSDTDTARRLGQVVRGPQTAKKIQPELTTWVPLLFWFNKDCRLAIPSVAIPYGQRFITIELATQSQLVCLSHSAFIETTTTVSDYTGGTIGVLADLVSQDVTVTRTPVMSTGGTLASQTLSNLELYINNIFMNPEIHDIYIKRIGFTLIRVHRLQTFTVNTESSDVLLSQLKYPIETIYAGMRPTVNTTDSTRSCTDWHRFTFNTPQVSETSANSIGVVPTAADATLAAPQTYKAPVETLTFRVPQRTVDRLVITAHGIPIFNDFDADFFNRYMPYTYGGTNIVTPHDEGVLMINFCLYPGTYQPSGHLNFSRAREFYIQYFSSLVGVAGSGVASAELVIDAEAINFLLISDGSAVLRYST